MSQKADNEWSPQRLRALDVVIRHLLPSSQNPSVSDQVLEALAEPRFAGQALFVLALLDELSAENELGELSAQQRESRLRSVESSGDPYLGHGLRLLVALSLEAFYAVRTTRPHRPGPAEETGPVGEERARS